jgi:D-alanyl-D-alanine-carboxypeptidase/D-alanyl-D-alanine-endopeptidase
MHPHSTTREWPDCPVEAIIEPMRYLSMVFALLVSPPLVARAQQPADVPDDVRVNVRARVDAGAWPGVVIGVVDRTGTRYFSFGNTALSGGKPVGPRTMYEIGSITKVFTSLALADMVVHGQVGLDDSLQRYLPDDVKAPERSGKPITLRLLAAQRSGLPEMPSNFAPRDPTNPYADYDTTRLYSFLSGYTLPRDPGAQYQYSNFGVGLLGAVLARHDHASYPAMIDRRVLGPLGMTSTMVQLTPDARDRLATGHANGKPAANWDLDALAGAGALRSDAEDMTRFVASAMGLTSTPLDSAFRLTETPQFDAGSPVMRIGLGWHILQRPSMRIVWHNGGTGGYRSFTGFDPERRIGVVVLSNSTVSVDDLGFHVLDSTMALLAPRIAVAIAADSLEAYVGRYQLSPTFTIAITRDGGALFLQATGQDRFGLFASGRNEFFLRAVDAGISFERDGQDQVVALILHQNGANQRAARTP